MQGQCRGPWESNSVTTLTELDVLCLNRPTPRPHCRRGKRIKGKWYQITATFSHRASPSEFTALYQSAKSLFIPPNPPTKASWFAEACESVQHFIHTTVRLCKARHEWFLESCSEMMKVVSGELLWMSSEIRLGSFFPHKQSPEHRRVCRSKWTHVCECVCLCVHMGGCSV